MLKKLLLLFLTFAKIGSITFGGGLTMLPLLTREIVEKRKWATEQELLDYYAVGQCTPGIIAVNTATFIGYYQAGVLGGISATVGMVTPSIIIIVVVAAVLQQFMEYQIVSSALMGIRAVVCALLAHTVITLSKKSLVDIPTVVLFIIGLVLCFVFNITPIIVVIVGGVAGLILGKIKEVRSK
jgi:chromate transporter